jgi:hypothetical protein
VNRWRIVVVLSAILAFAVIVASGFLPARALLFGPRPLAGGDVSAIHGWSPWMLPVLGPAGRILAQLGALLAQFVVALILLYVIPDRIRVMAQAMTLGPRSVLRHLGSGLALAVSLAAAGVLSVLSLHMFPLPFILLGLLFTTALIGAAAIALAVGRGLLRRAGWYGNRPARALALGTLIMSAVAVVPAAGELALALTLITGAGVCVATRFGTGRAWTLDPIVEDVTA